ncbi:hypothetical protein PCURB6_31020 [Paenibacillus curdlanolyticus]|nr:hypothetical protein PCURB6_31020 [Paenibacillus curdlanolyticus]
MSTNAHDRNQQSLIRIMEHSAEGFFMLNEDDIFTYINPQAGFLLFRDHRELIGKSFWGEFPMAKSPYFFEKYMETKQRQRVIVFESYYAHSDVRYEIKLIPNGSGVSVLLRDVTSLTHLSSTGQRYRSLFERHPDAVYTVLPDGTIANANLAAVELLGYEAQEILHAPLTLFIEPKDVPIAERCYDDVMKGRTGHCVIQTIRKDGEKLITQVTMLPMAEGGEQIGVFVIAQDVTAFYTMHNQLKESEHRYKMLSENARDIITYLSPEGDFQYVSPAIERLLGYRPEEVLGTSAWSYLHPECREMLGGNISISALSGVATCRIRHRIGHFIWFELSYRSVIDEMDGQERLVGVWRDITERKKAEQHLLQAQRIRRFGSWEYNIAYSKTRWSDETYRIFGFQPGTPVTLQLIAAHLHPDDMERTITAFKSISMAEEVDIHYRIVRPDGQIRHIHTYGERMSLHGEPYAIFGVHCDLTEYMKAEAALNRSRDSLRMAQQLAGLGYFEWDIADNRWILSDEIIELWGCNRQPSDQSIEQLLESVHPEDRHRVEHAIMETLKGIKMDIIFRIIRSTDGSMRTMHAISQTVCGDQGQPIRVFGTVHNITERKQSEERLRQSEKLSAAGQLAAGIAHEIRNPLTALKGFTKLLRHAPEHNRDRYYDIMQNEFNRIELILGELLVLSKPQTVTRKPDDIGAIVSEVSELLGSQALLNNVLVQADVPSDLPLVYCERNQIKQVFVNMMKNAIEAMPSGGLLKIGAEAVGGEVRVYFSDQGEGIPAERLSKIKEPFFTTKEQGTGLGLMVSFNIIEEHRGSIRYESEPGRGTTVYISLPAWLEEA